MKRPFLLRTLLAGAIGLGIVAQPTIQAAIIFDDFNVNEGHFTSAYNGSGSSANIGSTSTMDRITTDGPLEGAGHQKLVLNAATVGTAMRLRHLSGGGSAGANTAFITTSGTDGWIGLYVKADPATDPNWTVSIWIEGSAVGNNASIPKTIIADGDWHLYEWNLDDDSGGPDGWGTVTGILAGTQWVTNGSHTIDSVIFRNANGPASSTLFMDFVALNPNGSVADLLADPCLNTSGVLAIGPISTNSNQVVVSGVDGSATAVTVYQNTGAGDAMVAIGSKTTGITVGENSVTVSGLVKGKKVVATQTVNNQESCVPADTAGITVGGGANPRLRMAASIRQPGGLTGPIGANGGGSATTIYWIHATGANVAGGVVLQPSTNWQTVVFYPTDSKFLWNGTFTFPDLNQYGALEGFGLAIDDLTDTGPYEVYLDNLRNGTTLIQDFENETPGTEVQFPKPGNSGTTSGNILTAPDLSVVSTNYAATGTNSALLRWQWNGLIASKWVRLNALSPLGTEPTPNPVVDITQPIAIDVLLLPVNQTNAHSLGMVNLVENRTNCSGDNVTFTVSVAPPEGANPNYTYQWKFKGVNISGATTSSFTTNAISAASAGVYSVAVSDGIYTVTPAATLTVPAEVAIDAQPVDNYPMPGDGTMAAYFSVGASVPPECPCANTPDLAYQWRLNGQPVPGGTDASLLVNPVWMTNGGTYTVLVSNTCNGGTLLSAPAKLYVYDPSIPPITANCGGYNGLLGFYWTNQTAANAFTSAATWTNNDGVVEYDWGQGTPLISPWDTATNNFAIRWVGTVQPYYPNQTYTFYTTSDDGVRLWVDGKLLIDKWVAQSATEWSGSIALGSAPVNLVLEYYEAGSLASVKLAYESLSVNKQTIPLSQLCAADPATGVPPIVKLTAPANNATTTLGSAVTLTAAVTVNSAPVNKVEFYNHGTNLLDTVTAPGPYTKSWTPSATGVYDITAKVYYNTTSTLETPVNKLTVNPPPLSSVNITGMAGTAINYTGGAGAQFVLLKSADVAAAAGAWTRVATNTVTPGSFTIPAVGTDVQAYYRIKSE